MKNKRRRTRRKRVWTWLGIVALLALCVTAGSCVSISDGTWYIKEAKLPEGWPTLTPVGRVQVKRYPAYRAAVVQDAELPAGGERPMFRVLFRHIKDRQIDMTAPVEIGYDVPAQEEPSDKGEMVSMAFLYRQSTQGQIEDDGPVSVRDMPGRTHVSIGVRGAYTQDRFNAQLKILDVWLDEQNAEWQPNGQPRYLGYNSPFIPSFMRYGEVQLPIQTAHHPE